MDRKKIQSALADITAEQDPTVKSLKLASICSSLWAERGVELVVVGGSAIEILTEGAYTSGDLDMCQTTATAMPIRDRQEVMGLLTAKGGPRNWEIAGMFLDLLGPAESFARTPYRKIRAPYGTVLVMKPEDLLVERILVSVYPEKNQTARACAQILLSGMLRGQIEVDWDEVRRLAKLPEYRNFADCKKLIEETANELKIKSPFDSD
jgi:hypothetical protein